MYVKRKVGLRIEATFDVVGSIYNLVERYNAERLEEEFSEDGSLVMSVSVPQERGQELLEAISNATSGQIVPVIFTL